MVEQGRSASEQGNRIKILTSDEASMISVAIKGETGIGQQWEIRRWRRLVTTSRDTETTVQSDMEGRSTAILIEPLNIS